MPIIQSLRSLFGSRRNKINIIFGPEEAPLVESLDARQLYATQANLHAVVSFLADSIAQLPLKVYRRNGENDRVRDRTSVAAQLLYRPNADQTGYEFVERSPDGTAPDGRVHGLGASGSGQPQRQAAALDPA